MNSQELLEKIIAWEYRAGESFIDYFMDDNVKPVSWAFWLLGKGHKEHANKLINMIQAKERPDQHEMFEMHTYELEDFDQELYEKDMLLCAEFLTDSERYLKAIEEWFAENE